MKSVFEVKVYLLFLLLFGSVFSVVIAPLRGQEVSGDLNGVVKDSSGALMPGVGVTITNNDTGRIYRATAGNDGRYIAPNLEPGRYTVRFEMAGFGAVEVADVDLLPGRILKVDSTMDVAPVAQAVKVIETAPLLDLTGANIGHDVTAEEFARLPKGRSFQSLLLLSPSVNSGVDQYGNVVSIEGGFQVNGASAAENQFVIDGVPADSLVDGLFRQNAVFEFLQDVQVKTGEMEAEFGGALGGVISAVTKSGGNKFHGEAHYYFSGSGINAAPVKRLLLDPVIQASASFVQDPKQKDDRNEFGGSFGGPIVKDKLSFFVAASPQWHRATDNYLFTNSTQGAIQQKQFYQNLFAKISFDPTSRIRTNFTWLNTPTYSTGRLPGYNSQPGTLTTSLAANQANNNIGFSQEQTSYTGSVNFLITSKSVLTIRGARFWDDYKDTGIPAISAVTYNTSPLGGTLSPALLATVPIALQQPTGFNNTPRVQRSAYDITTRTLTQADYALTGDLWGAHELKIGAGTQKNVNKIDNTYPGGGFVTVFWGSSFRSLVPGSPCNINPCSGTYGYYTATDFGTRGSVGSNITNLYIQDNWRIHPRLSLNLGLRTEDETVPSFLPNTKPDAFKFGFPDKLAPRLGFAYDVLGNGNLKLSFGWGLFYDWVKYQIVRSAFGGSVYNVRYRALDTPNVFSLNGTNAPGADLWNPAVPDSFQNNRVPSFNAVAPNIKPMSSDLLNATVEYQWGPHTVLRGSYVHNNLRRAIEDLGSLIGGNNVYTIGNPGEGLSTITPPSGATTNPIPTPKPLRTYDAMELSVTRHFANGWFLSGSYVLSRLYGNYVGLSDSDEVITPTMGSSFLVPQQQAGNLTRPGTNTSRAWDLDEILFDSHGNLNVKGRLPTDRPNVVKLYGSYSFKFGTEVDAFFYAGSGTPISTYVNTTNGISVFVNGRGDMGRTPVLSQTDLMAAHQFKLTESKSLRFEFNMLNLFNQKTARHIFNSLNKGCQVSGLQSSAVDLSKVNLYQGYNYNALIQASPDGQKAYDPRYGMADLFNPGFAGRVGVKFIF